MKKQNPKITITIEVKKLLDNLGKKGDTYNKIIKTLIINNGKNT